MPPSRKAQYVWLLPVAFLLWLYRDAFSTWFLADDFAWLSLLHRVQLRHDLLNELFAPMAQGTIRPWSERGFFMVLQSLFGLDSLPFRIVAFATAAADVALIVWITLRATGSRVAGFVAPTLWIANTALVRAMTWSSAYNELLCPLFLLGALALFIKYIETGRREFWWWQLVVFSLGFGALEVNVVYPAIAAAWLLCVGNGSRRRMPTPDAYVGPSLRAVIPQAAISILYFAIHRQVAPLPKSGAYSLHFDLSILRTLVIYWKWSLVPEPIERYGRSHGTAELLLLTGTLAIAAYVISELKQRKTAVLFYLSWFAVTLAPMLPLKDHRTDYYLTIPVIGIAMLGGAAAGKYWNQSLMRRAIVVIPITAYLWAMVPVTEGVTQWWRNRSLSVRTLVLGVEAARQTHPGKAIVLDGITTELFNLSFAHSPFAAIGVNDVYLTPSSELTIIPDGQNADLESLLPDPEAMWHGLTHNDVVVYSLERDHLRNITEGYTRRVSLERGAVRTVDRLPTRIDVGNSLYAWLLGPQWLPPESGIRWMPGSATLRLGVPLAATHLELAGRCPSAQLLAVPRHLMVLVDGAVAGDTEIYGPESNFHRLFPMPAVAAGKTSVELEIRVDPVDRMDGQDYGLVFGKIAFLP